LNDSFRLQVGGDLGCGHRLAEAVALHKVHAGGEQEQVLVSGLDVFRRYFRAEAATEAFHRVHDRGGVRRLHGEHEAAVDLELVERQAVRARNWSPDSCIAKS
jgi:hypothetical protein